MSGCDTPPLAFTTPAPARAPVQGQVQALAASDRERRLQVILYGPVLPTLLRLGLPMVGVLLAQTAVSIAETYWTSFLGNAVLAGMTLVFPLSALMTATSNAGIGGGVSSAVSRAIGAGRKDEADALTTHALVLAVCFGLLFTAGALLAGPFVYRGMGGTGNALAAALLFSGWFFAGSVPIWIVNLLAAALRGAGEVRLPAMVTLCGAGVVIPLSPALIFGIGPLPRMGVGGAGLAVTLYFAGAMLVLLAHVRRGRGALALRVVPLRWRMFRDILGVGLVSALGTVMTNLTILLVTGAVGRFGLDALAGYGIASRLDWLLIPLLFGLGTAVVTMVGISTGAGHHARARRVAWLSTLLATVAAAAIGLLAASFPGMWLGLFTTDPAVLAAGARYLSVVAPSYGAVGLGLMLYFACQGQGRMLWPFMAGFTRLVVAAGGGYLLARHGTGLIGVFAAVAAGSVAFGALNVVGMLVRPRPPVSAAVLDGTRLRPSWAQNTS